MAKPERQKWQINSTYRLSVQKPHPCDVIFIFRLSSW